MANFKVATKDQLKEAVDKQLELIAPNNEIIISGVRRVNGGKIELEFVQARELIGSTNVVAILNKADERFIQSGKKVYRAWMSVEVESAKESLGLDFTEVAAIADTIKPEERVIVMQAIKALKDGNKMYALNLQVIQTTDASTIKDKSVRESIMNQDEYALNYELRFPNDKGEMENVVDENGNVIFHYVRTQLTDPDGPILEDQLVPNKKSLTRYLEDKGQGTKSFVKSLVPKTEEVVTKVDATSGLGLTI